MVVGILQKELATRGRFFQIQVETNSYVPSLNPVRGMHNTERSPKGCFSCRGMLDFDEDCKFDVMFYFPRLLMFIECQLFSFILVNYPPASEVSREVANLT